MNNSKTENNQEKQVESAEKKGICASFAAICQVICVCCYIVCPPIPVCIIRKVAFHPPKKGINYRIRLINDSNREINNAKQVRDEEFQLVPQMLSDDNSTDDERLMRSLETTVVRTKRGNYLVVVRAKPSNEPSEEALRRQVVLFSQPNSSDLGMFLHAKFVNLKMMADIFQCEVFAYDYSGFGYSTGYPSEANVYADIRAVYEHVRSTVPDKKINLLGFSIGTAVSTDLARDQPEMLAGLILMAPFTSGLRLLGGNPNKEESMCLDRFRTVEKIDQVTVPCLIIHGDRDKMISIEHAQHLHTRLLHPLPLFVVEGAGHQNIFSGQFPITCARIVTFLRNDSEIDVAHPLEIDFDETLIHKKFAESSPITPKEDE